MDNQTNLVLLFNRTGRNGHATVTAKFGDDILALEKVDLTKSEDRLKFAKQVCRGRKGIRQKEIEFQLIKAADALANAGSDDGAVDDSQASEQAADYLAKMPQQVRDEARAMLCDPQLFERIVVDVSALGVAGEDNLIGTLYLVGTSRQLERPLAMIVQGLTSSGKSYVIEQTARTFPPETVIHATRMTPQALFHMPAGSLRHKFIAAGERSRLENDDTAEATRALREMISAGKLSKLMPVKENGAIVTRLVDQEGPIAYTESTTLTKIFDEDANRCIIVTTDEREEQTRNIVSTLAQRYAGQTSGVDGDRIIQRHFALQRMLEKLQVVVPFAQRLGELFASDRVEARRAFPQLISMIQAAALLHQYQRRRDSDDRLIAQAEDYRIARELLAKPFTRMLGGGVSEPALRYLERLEGWFGGPFSTTQAKARESACERAVRDWLNELHFAGAVELIEPGRGPIPSTWKLSGMTAEMLRGKRGPLPTVEMVFGR